MKQRIISLRRNVKKSVVYLKVLVSYVFSIVIHLQVWGFFNLLAGYS